MSFYRTLLAAVAAVAIASPVFADDANPAAQDSNNNNAPTQTLADNTQATAPAASPSEAQSKININTASVKDLMKIKELNASKARAIVAYRKKNGNFKSTDDLANVKGFKKMNTESLKSIEDQVTVE